MKALGLKNHMMKQIELFIGHQLIAFIYLKKINSSLPLIIMQPHFMSLATGQVMSRVLIEIYKTHLVVMLMLAKNFELKLPACYWVMT
jgi:hypothetical protein